MFEQHYWCYNMYIQGCPNSHNQRGSYCLWWKALLGSNHSIIFMNTHSDLFPFQVVVWSFPSHTLILSHLLTHSLSLSAVLTLTPVELAQLWVLVKWVFSARLSAWTLICWLTMGLGSNSLTTKLKFLVTVCLSTVTREHCPVQFSLWWQ